jgi:MerR family transcriptional regulator, light-induced transcriptional regulator
MLQTRETFAPDRWTEFGVTPGITAQVAGLLGSGRFLDEPWIDALTPVARALSGDDDDLRRRVLGNLRLQGVSQEEIVDVLVPSIARQLGADWCSDRTSFADVTIGVGRLQQLVREIGTQWRSGTLGHNDSPCVLMVVQEEDYHTLGPMLAATQFRRMGVSVQMSLGRSDAEVVSLLRHGAFDMVTISIAWEGRLESLRNMINLVKSSRSSRPPVVVGGSYAGDGDDIKGFSGADHVTSDPNEALRLCGLHVSETGALRQT